MMHYCLDKIYYPLLPVFHKYRNLEKQKGEMAIMSVLNKEEFTDTKELDKYKSKRYLHEQDISMIERIDEEIKAEKEQFQNEYEKMMDDLHSNYINDEHFEEGKYGEFLDRYIHCYYEPLVPEYDEAKFSIKNFDSKFRLKMKLKGINSDVKSH